MPKKKCRQCYGEEIMKLLLPLIALTISSCSSTNTINERAISSIPNEHKKETYPLNSNIGLMQNSNVSVLLYNSKLQYQGFLQDFLIIQKCAAKINEHIAIVQIIDECSGTKVAVYAKDLDNYLSQSIPRDDIIKTIATTEEEKQLYKDNNLQELITVLQEEIETLNAEKESIRTQITQIKKKIDTYEYILPTEKAQAKKEKLEAQIKKITAKAKPLSAKLSLYESLNEKYANSKLTMERNQHAVLNALTKQGDPKLLTIDEDKKSSLWNTIQTIFKASLPCGTIGSIEERIKSCQQNKLSEIKDKSKKSKIDYKT